MVVMGMEVAGNIGIQCLQKMLNMDYLFRLKDDRNSPLFSKQQLFDEIREQRVQVDSLLFSETGDYVGTIAKIFPISSRLFWPAVFINCIECGSDISKLTPTKNEGFCARHAPDKHHETQRHKTERFIKEKWPLGYRLNWPTGHKLGNG
jgi:hypothetical protein